jgi:hypothetical protein
MPEFDLTKVHAGQEEAGASKPSDEIIALGEEAQERIREIEYLEDQLSDKKKELKHLQEVLLPAAMDNLGLDAFKLKTGEMVTRKPFVHSRLADPSAAFRWLRANNEDSIIKNEISVKLMPGDDAAARDVMEYLELRGYAATQKETIHHSTLSAFVREALENPTLKDSLPRDAFGVYEGETVIIKK